MERHAELGRLLRTAGVARSEVDGPIVTRQGYRIPWTLYSLGATLASSDGMTLAAKGVLDLVERFGPCQLAAHGLTAAPLLGAVIALSGGRYSGLLIRTTLKDYGLRRYVEGRATDLPVVIIDDSISAGTSFRRAARLLEHEGHAVAGTACLVEFPRRGGRERAEACGYRVEALFDVWTDLEMPVPDYVPGHLRGDPAPWDERTPSDLQPADAAMLVARHFLTHGRALLPPARFGMAVDARGGTYVSFREIRSDRRLARDGFWHFRTEDANAERDLVLATVKAVRAGRLELSQLDRLKCAVSFFGPLRSARVADLDYERLGIVVRGKHWPKTGGALPNTQVFTSEAQQLRHARRTNAGLGDFEPHDLYVHEIVKHVESGHSWPLFGTAVGEGPEWIRDPRVGEQAQRTAYATLKGEPSDGDPFSPSGFAGAAVSIYRSGIAGCSIAMGEELHDCVRRATAAAAQDRRFDRSKTDSPRGAATLVVSLLHHPEHWGTLPREAAERKLRVGRDTVWVRQGERQGVLLDSVPVHYNWDRKAFIGALIDKARLRAPPYDWTAYQTASWIVSAGRAMIMDRGFIDRRDAAPLGAADVELLAEHL
ncbi:MAG TPA: AMMECR1 domain-containing protein, partial [Polyangiaceae bacterium]|nr:AMMECR1 domain-containing protein [Polyangiaceae bacterium]